MTISSIPATPVQFQTSTSSSAPANAGGLGSIGSQLLADIAQTTATGVSTSPFLQELVSLNGNAQSSPLTYNAQGLLNQVQSAMPFNDPLLQSQSPDTSDANNSLFADLIAPGQAAGASTSAGSTNADWAQVLQQDPSQAAALVQSQLDQGILNMLP
ncbi:MAG TPA: hypothetical protein VMV33_11865 [Rhodocyclaceae bacterium]|nr:hypothetical protein [Rhodocyclaceae bacterium]